MTNWNSYHEDLLKKWSQTSKTYAIMHSLSAQYYSTWHKRLGIPIVILGGATASSIFSSNKEDSELWTYINGTLVMITTALTGISSFLGTTEKMSKHQTASFKYNKIALDIDSLLSFSRFDRFSTPQDFINEKKREMLEIRENAPEVLPWIISDYLKSFDKSLSNTQSTVNRETEPIRYVEAIPVIHEPRNDYSENNHVEYRTTTRVSRNAREAGNVSEAMEFRRGIEPDFDIESGEILSEFNDPITMKIQEAGEKLSKLENNECN